ncbi:FRIGIDA-like protein 4a [Silene latifolia]|uniref:FRIGIDA-like protein 4a n=1 Tax=Silene latifolia TaxID=37657 RepID=UPI003D788E42
MAETTTITEEIPETITTLFTKLEEQKTLLTNCTTLYKTLTTHFTNLQNSVEIKSQTLDSRFQTLDSKFTQTLDSLKTREDSLPELQNSLSSTVETKKSVALSEVSKPIPNESTPLPDILTTMCRRMEPGSLMRLLVEKRRETMSLREKMGKAFSECVDSERFVVEAVREFVEMKKEKRAGLIDTRWACSMVVRSMFPPEELKKGKVGNPGLGRVFAKKAVERAEEVLKEWRMVSDNEGLEGVGEGTGMGPAEAAMFIEVLLGFGLKEKFEEEFYIKLMLEFCGRRDMAKLAIPIFGDKIADLIEELVKNGKQVEAVYFATESGLTDRFQPVSLLKSFLQKTDRESRDIRKKGNHSASATDKANSLESISIRSIIKCVEDHKIEEEFPVESLRKRLAVLERAKNDRKNGTTARVMHSKRGATSGPPSSRPAKVQKPSSPYTKFPVGDQVLPSPLSPVSRYLAPYAHPSQPSYHTQTTYPSQTGYPSQATYDTGTAAAAPAYQTGQPHYGIPGDSGASAEARLGGSYGSQEGYVPYDYSATTAAPAYGPTSYPQ